MSANRRARVVIFGASGRMGTAIAKLLTEVPGIELAGQVLRGPNGEPSFLDAENQPVSAARLLSVADVVVDFTLPEAVDKHLQLCLEHHVPYVCGVTGLSEATVDRFARLGDRHAILWAPNMSASVTICFEAAADIARRLDGDFHVSITDIHHEGKTDAPSGTALEFGRVISEASPKDTDIIYSSLRTGSHPGEHHIVFYAGHDEIELRHRAGSRSEFARGALRAAQWLAGQRAGFYNMRNVLGITTSS